MRILMPSIVDPAVERGGAWTVTRGLVGVLQGTCPGAKVEVIPVRARTREAHRRRRWCAVAQSMVSKLPSKIVFTRSREMLATVKRRLREEKFDLVLINGTDLLWLLPYLPAGTAVALVAHNIEHQLFAEQLRFAEYPALIKRWLSLDLKRLQEFEVEGLRKTGNVIFLSTEDARFAEGLGMGMHAITVPPIFAAPTRVRISGRRASAAEGPVEVGMFANFDWWPNMEGLQWLVADILPQIKQDMRLHLFGSGSERVPAHPMVVRHGYVHEAAEVWDQCDFMLSPVVGGGGVAVKTAEALSNQVPVVATPAGLRGLPVKDDPGVVVVDGADAWVAFLNSERATEMRGRCVGWETASRFHAVSYADELARFVREVAGLGTR